MEQTGRFVDRINDALSGASKASTVSHAAILARMTQSSANRAMDAPALRASVSEVRRPGPLPSVLLSVQSMPTVLRAYPVERCRSDFRVRLAQSSWLCLFVNASARLTHHDCE